MGANGHVLQIKQFSVEPYTLFLTHTHTIQQKRITGEKRKIVAWYNPQKRQKELKLKKTYPGIRMNNNCRAGNKNKKKFFFSQQFSCVLTILKWTINLWFMASSFSVFSSLCLVTDQLNRYEVFVYELHICDRLIDGRLVGCTHIYRLNE